jgi:hypothetical protein
MYQICPHGKQDGEPCEPCSKKAMSKLPPVRSEPLLSPLVVSRYEETLKALGVPQKYPFLSSGYCEELCAYIRTLKDHSGDNAH